jgi:MFS transporter, DHA1 family, multidrug resistance protein
MERRAPLLRGRRRVAGSGRGTSDATRTRRIAATVLFLSFVDVFALLPTVAPHATALGAGPAMLGLVVGAYSAANLPANLVGGVLVDRIGRRRVVLLGLALAVLTVAAYPLAGTPAQLVAVRLAHGIAGGVLVPAVFALAGDRAPAGATGRTMGRLGALIGAAAVVAPAGAGAVRQLAGTDAVFVVVAGLLALGWVVAWLGVTEHRATPGSAIADAGSTDAAPGTLRLGHLLLLGPLRRALAATATMTAAVGALAAFLPARAEELGAPPALVGALFTLYALLAAAVMLGPLAGRVDRGDGDRPLAVGLGILALALVGTALAPGVGVALAAMAVFGVGYGLVFPAATATTSLVAGPEARGRAFGLFNAAFSIGLAAGPPLLGVLAQQVPAADPFLVAAGLCLAAAGTLAASRPR